NQFHSYRRTADDRILFGGYDAVYRFGGPVGPEHDTDEATFGRLAQHFFTTFPQLEGLRFTHRWGGAIDTCSRFSVFFGTAHGGRVAYATGYTGLGVVAARFGAQVALDLLDDRDGDVGHVVGGDRGERPGAGGAERDEQLAVLAVADDDGDPGAAGDRHVVVGAVALDGQHGDRAAAQLQAEPQADLAEADDE